MFGIFYIYLLRYRHSVGYLETTNLALNARTYDRAIKNKKFAAIIISSSDTDLTYLNYPIFKSGSLIEFTRTTEEFTSYVLPHGLPVIMIYLKGILVEHVHSLKSSLEVADWETKFTNLDLKIKSLEILRSTLNDIQLCIFNVDNAKQIPTIPIGIKYIHVNSSQLKHFEINITKGNWWYSSLSRKFIPYLNNTNEYKNRILKYKENGGISKIYISFYVIDKNNETQARKAIDIFESLCTKEEFLQYVPFLPLAGSLKEKVIEHYELQFFKAPYFAVVDLYAKKLNKWIFEARTYDIFNQQSVEYFINNILNAKLKPSYPSSFKNGVNREFPEISEITRENITDFFNETRDSIMIIVDNKTHIGEYETIKIAHKILRNQPLNFFIFNATVNQLPVNPNLINCIPTLLYSAKGERFFQPFSLDFNLINIHYFISHCSSNVFTNILDFFNESIKIQQNMPPINISRPIKRDRQKVGRNLEIIYREIKSLTSYSINEILEMYNNTNLQYANLSESIDKAMNTSTFLDEIYPSPERIDNNIRKRVTPKGKYDDDQSVMNQFTFSFSIPENSGAYEKTNSDEPSKISEKETEKESPSSKFGAFKSFLLGKISRSANESTEEDKTVEEESRQRSKDNAAEAAAIDAMDEQSKEDNSEAKEGEIEKENETNETNSVTNIEKAQKPPSEMRSVELKLIRRQLKALRMKSLRPPPEAEDETEDETQKIISDKNEIIGNANAKGDNKEDEGRIASDSKSGSQNNIAGEKETENDLIINHIQKADEKTDEYRNDEEIEKMDTEQWDYGFIEASNYYEGENHQEYEYEQEHVYVYKYDEYAQEGYELGTKEYEEASAKQKERAGYILSYEYFNYKDNEDDIDTESAHSTEL